MRDVLTILPIYLFMLIPVWIPLIAMSLGGLHDLITAPARRKPTPVRATVAARRISPAGPQGSAARTAA